MAVLDFPSYVNESFMSAAENMRSVDDQLSQATQRKRDGRSCHAASRGKQLRLPSL
jgi:hypothetical protein